ncbi:transposase [Parabacteroides sp. CAG:409]|mgnify:FL=1|nr:transposase [Parabacteroides sp. CAG:409]
MSQSLAKNYIHLIFATKYRENIIKQTDLSELYAYITGILNHIDCPMICIGGTTNHVHVLCVLNKNMALSKMVEEVKRSSSKWIKSKEPFYRQFGWQNGYGAFSVSQSKVEIVVKYIQNQEEHHKKMLFVDELKMFLREYGVEYKEEYL